MGHRGREGYAQPITQFRCEKFELADLLHRGEKIGYDSAKDSEA